MAERSRPLPLPYRQPASVQRPFALPAWLSCPDMRFWLALLALNALLFVPMYIMNRGANHFWPGPLVDGWHTLLLWRQNLDVFRLHAELILMTGLWLFVGWPAFSRRRRLLRGIFGLGYGFSLLYGPYEAFMLSNYQTAPNFYSDGLLIRDNALFLLHSLHLPLSTWLLALALVVGVGVTVSGLLRQLWRAGQAQQLHPLSHVFMLLLLLYVLLVAVGQPGSMAAPQWVLRSQVAELGRNLRSARQTYHSLSAYENLDPHAVYRYDAYPLRQKPDIYLIFVESYGSVLYQREHFRPAYEAMLADMQAELTAGGWYQASALSESPTWGAGSWMAYTSAEFGVHIGEQPQFLAFKERYSQEPYPSLGRYLQAQGYVHARLSPLPTPISESEWQGNVALYGADRWFRFADLHYEGSLYGWGPAPPDQYSLNYARSRLLADGQQPHFLVYLTQASHYPWMPLPPLVDDWRLLQQKVLHAPLPAREPIPYVTKITQYPAAIRYELAVLTDFILSTPQENAIYILIGDHQPPAVSRRSDGFGTPIHVICKDPDIISAFLAYNFKQGLFLNDFTPQLKHEALYSLLVRVLVSRYGWQPDNLPPYLPDGIPLPATVSQQEE